MPTSVISEPELRAFSSWPDDVAHSDLVACFYPGLEDIRWLRSHRNPVTRLAQGLRLTGLPYLGFVPHPVEAPHTVVRYVADQIGVSALALDEYAAAAERTRREHAATAISYLGWSVCRRGEWKRLRDWLVATAIEHDTPSVLFRQALTYLRAERIVRPGLDRLIRAVGSARATAVEEIHRMLSPVLTPAVRHRLDLLIGASDPEIGMARLVWLHTGALPTSPRSIRAEVAKLDYLRSVGAHRVDLSPMRSDRRRHMAQVARRSTPASLRRMAPQRRYPLLAAAVTEAYRDIIDEIVVMFDQSLSTLERRIRRLIRDDQVASAATDRDRLDLLDAIIDVALNPALDDIAVGRWIRGLGSKRLVAVQRPPTERGRARDSGLLGYLKARYSHVRASAPYVVAVLKFHASVKPSVVLEATKILQHLNATNRRNVPPGAPTEFIPARWRPYLSQATADSDHTAFRHYWELALLYALRNSLRSGEIRVEGSRRYADPATYLPTDEEWHKVRAETLSDSESRLRLQRLTAEHVDPATMQIGQELAAHLPSVPLSELLIEVDQATGFTNHLTHAGGAQPRHPALEHQRNLYTAIFAQACNFGIGRMAELCGISPDTITWTTRWYLREDTIRAANAAIINTHHRHPLAHVWGGGTLSSSDGLRFPIRGRSLTARAHSRYFVNQGGTAYTHVSDQHTTYGTQMIVATDRDATYVLDEILGNTTDLPIAEHTTDTHGQTLLTFALFDLVGLRLSPRIAKLTQQRLWRPHPPSHYHRWPQAGRLLAHPVQTQLIDQHWDDLLRLGRSVTSGHVSAALLIARLQAGTRQHPLAKALIEYGKLQRTNHALRWFTDEAFRRRIGRQLNRGESLNGLRRFLFFANRGEISHQHREDQTTQAHCHTLLTNACILWTTIYLGHAITAHQNQGHTVEDQHLAHISPARFQHINPYGTYNLNVEAVLQRIQHRPLKPATTH